MKVGFSSLVCPEWNLETVLAKASEMGVDGVELHGLQGESDLLLSPDVAADPQPVRKQFQDAGVDLVCLDCPATLDSFGRREVGVQKSLVEEYVELAAALGCPHVRIHAGHIQRLDHRRAALSRIATALGSLVPSLSRLKVTLLVENGGDFPDAEAMWFLVDSAGHPAVRVCWNQCQAMTVRQRATSSLPRLAGKIGLVHIQDATFSDHGMLLEHKPPGEGDAEVARQIDLLKGLMYDGYLMLAWPQPRTEALLAPDVILPQAAKFLRERIEAKQAVLSAYKGDKRPPRLASRGPAAPAAAPVT